MLVAISPAKRLDWSPVDVEMSHPAMGTDAIRLAKTMRGLTLGKLKDLMDMSDELARLNRDRYRVFEERPDRDATRPAVFAFAGDTYQGLDARSFDADDLRWAQDHLRILSGLYGILRPLDAVQPYRLEMGSRLRTRRGDTLYAYWRDTLAKALNAQAQEVGTPFLVNCASQEYFGAVDRKRLTLEVITPQFLELRDGTTRMISFHAKRARGAMARFILCNRISDPAALADFDDGGYRFCPSRSQPGAPVFVREADAG